MLVLGASPSMAQSRAHVYLLRGLMNIFSLGMDTLCDELNKRGIYATVYNHTAWQELADQAAADYKTGKEGPIILIGHSLGANAVMQMAAYDRQTLQMDLAGAIERDELFPDPISPDDPVFARDGRLSDQGLTALRIRMP